MLNKFLGILQEIKAIVRKISYYLLPPLTIILGIIVVLYWRLGDLEKSVNIAATFVQTMAIFVGGLWAYRKFGWEKRAESAIKIKAMLMKYEQLHNEAAGQYRLDQQNKKDWFECWKNYAMRMIPAVNEFKACVHLSCYVPKRVRQRLFDVVSLSLNKGRTPKKENLDKNWEAFGKELKKIKKELDSLVSK